MEEIKGEEDELVEENDALKHDIEISDNHLDLLIKEHYEV